MIKPSGPMRYGVCSGANCGAWAMAEVLLLSLSVGALMLFF